MKWCDLIDPDSLEPQALNFIRTSYDLMCFSSWDVTYTMLRKRLDGDNEVNWRHDMFSDIIYAYFRKGVMLDNFDMTLLLNSESLSNRFWWYRKMKPKHTFWKISNGFKSFKNNMFEVLSGRILFDRGIKNLVRNDSFLFIMKFLVKILHKYDKKYSHNACNLVTSLELIQWDIAYIQIRDRKIWLFV